MKIPARLTTGTLGAQTPAQVSGNYDFVNDVPIQGPTDPGMRAASCWWTQNVLPVKDPACVDCKGPVPTWARNPSAWGGGPAEYTGNGYPCGWGKEMVRYGDRGMIGDPETVSPPGEASWKDTFLDLHGRLNTLAKISIGAGAVLVVGGIVYAATEGRRR